LPLFLLHPSDPALSDSLSPLSPTSPSASLPLLSSSQKLEDGDYFLALEHIHDARRQQQHLQSRHRVQPQSLPRRDSDSFPSSPTVASANPASFLPNLSISLPPISSSSESSHRLRNSDENVGAAVYQELPAVSPHRIVGANHGLQSNVLSSNHQQATSTMFNNTYHASYGSIDPPLLPQTHGSLHSQSTSSVSHLNVDSDDIDEHPDFSGQFNPLHPMQPSTASSELISSSSIPVMMPSVMSQSKYEAEMAKLDQMLNEVDDQV
jgi:hypothetical protein